MSRLSAARIPAGAHRRSHSDPYPFLDPLLASADIVAGEMPAGAINTGKIVCNMIWNTH